MCYSHFVQFTLLFKQLFYCYNFSKNITKFNLTFICLENMRNGFFQKDIFVCTTHCLGLTWTTPNHIVKIKSIFSSSTFIIVKLFNYLSFEQSIIFTPWPRKLKSLIRLWPYILYILYILAMNFSFCPTYVSMF